MPELAVLASRKPSLEDQREASRALEKAERGERITPEEGVALAERADVLDLGKTANRIRRRRHGNRVHYRNDLNVNHTNVCVARCGFCSFYRRGHEEDAYTLTVQDAEAKARRAVAQGVQEFHVVGGLHPSLRLPYFEELFRALERTRPDGHVQGLTAVEVDYIAVKERLPVREVLRRLHAAGLDSLPGGGSEIFSPEVRREMLATKIGTERWLAVHAEAHALGIPTNATMLYGHVEERRHRVQHMEILREHQDAALRRGGERYRAFVPLAYNPENNALQKRRALRGTTGLDDLRTVAIARIYLDNFEHVKLPWVTVGKPLAQTALGFGADDIGGSAFEERILDAAGGHTWELVGHSELPGIIRRAGFEVVWTSGVYDRVWGQEP